jgi:hypothetical protein
MSDEFLLSKLITHHLYLTLIEYFFNHGYYFRLIPCFLNYKFGWGCDAGNIFPRAFSVHPSLFMAPSSIHPLSILRGRPEAAVSDVE